MLQAGLALFSISDDGRHPIDQYWTAMMLAAPYQPDAFALPDGIVYLNGNSLGPLPLAARRRLDAVTNIEWGQGLVTSWTKHDWINLPKTVGAKIAHLVGAGPTDVICADSTSINLFKLAAAALKANPGRRTIVTEDGNFPADVYILEGLAALLPDVTLKVVPRADVLAALDSDTALLALTHIHYASGERFDMAAVTDAAHKTGALTLWDLSHSTGAVAVDLQGSGADFAVGCGYKYLNGGPGAPGFAYVHPRHQAALNTPLQGWLGHKAPFAFEGRYTPAADTASLVSGTPPILSMSALDAALSAFDGLDMNAVEAEAGALGDMFIEQVLAKLPDFILASPRIAKARGAHVSLRHPDGYAIMLALIGRGIIGDFRTPDILRFGFSPLYVTTDDVDVAISILAEIMNSGAWRDPAYQIRRAVT